MLTGATRLIYFYSEIDIIKSHIGYSNGGSNVNNTFKKQHCFSNQI